MTETMNAIPGINAETLAGFAGYAAENPDEVLLTAEAKAIWAGHAGHSTAKIGPWTMAGQRIEKASRDYSIQFGAWKEVEEAIGVESAGDKIEPVEGALAAMCSCVTWAICLNAARQGISFDSLEVKATADVDPRILVGEMSTDNAAALIRSVELCVDVQGQELSQEDRVRIEDMINRSPVHAMVKYANPMKTTVTLA